MNIVISENKESENTSSVRQSFEEYFSKVTEYVAVSGMDSLLEENCGSWVERES